MPIAAGKRIPDSVPQTGIRPACPPRPFIYKPVILRLLLPKNLPRCFRLNCCLPALRPTPFVNFSRLAPHEVSRESAVLAAFNSYAFREILRPKEGLRMTISKQATNRSVQAAPFSHQTDPCRLARMDDHRPSRCFW